MMERDRERGIDRETKSDLILSVKHLKEEKKTFKCLKTEKETRGEKEKA